LRIIGYGVAFIGLAIFVLGMLAPSYKVFVASTGAGFVLLGLVFVKSSSLKPDKKA
jgi:hypothetical protein